MTYKKSMLYGIFALGLAQALSVLYGYLFNSLNELGTATIPLSVLAILIMAVFGVVPGVLLHFLKSKLPSFSSIAIGFIIFLGFNSIGYLAANEIKEPTIEIIYSSIVFSLCGAFMGFLYSKNCSKKVIHEIT